jgi:excisionase family DNA binding protein
MGLLEEISARLQNVESLLIELKQNPFIYQPETQQEEFLTVEQASEFLNLSIQTIHNMTHEKRIPFMKRSKRCYFLKDDLIKYLKDGRKKTSSELSEEAERYNPGKKKGL